VASETILNPTQERVYSPLRKISRDYPLHTGSLCVVNVVPSIGLSTSPPRSRCAPSDVWSVSPPAVYPPSFGSFGRGRSSIRRCLGICLFKTPTPWRGLQNLHSLLGVCVPQFSILFLMSAIATICLDRASTSQRRESEKAVASFV